MVQRKDGKIPYPSNLNLCIRYGTKPWQLRYGRHHEHPIRFKSDVLTPDKSQVICFSNTDIRYER